MLRSAGRMAEERTRQLCELGELLCRVKIRLRLRSFAGHGARSTSASTGAWGLGSHAAPPASEPWTLPTAALPRRHRNRFGVTFLVHPHSSIPHVSSILAIARGEATKDPPRLASVAAGSHIDIDGPGGHQRSEL